MKWLIVPIRTLAVLAFLVAGFCGVAYWMEAENVAELAFAIDFGCIAAICVLIDVACNASLRVDDSVKELAAINKRLAAAESRARQEALEKAGD